LATNIPAPAGKRTDGKPAPRHRDSPASRYQRCWAAPLSETKISKASRDGVGGKRTNDARQGLVLDAEVLLRNGPSARGLCSVHYWKGLRRTARRFVDESQMRKR